MGSTSSKFRKALYAGDEKVAEELYHGSVEFQKVFDPNSSYGENYSHNTALHYASRHGMHRLVRIFIQRHSGNPNKRNSDNQTSLHCICMEEQIRPPSSTYSYSQYYYSQPPEKKRLECLRLVLVWRGIAMGEGEREQIQIDAEDEDGNTALHYAAGSGYLSLVEMLLEHNASMFVENADKETPCDSAERHQHIDIAQLLESKMVFSSPTNEEEDVEEIGAIQYEEAYSGLRLQELQEAKDLVVVETADMLRVPLFTAEALLRNFEWSREALLECWIQNPEECCEKCGVKPPENLDRFAEEHKLSSLEPKPVTPQEEPIMCDICTSTVPAEEISSDTLCSHQFCRDCWERYLSGKIKEGNAHSIVCPGYDCDRLVPVETIEKLVSREMARRYLQFDINAFVESNPKLKWCPVAGCGRAVQMPQRDPTTPYATSSNRPSGASSPSTPPSISHAVDCGQGHIFCWDCSGDAHEPCCCENWKKWMDKIAEIKPEELASTDSETELAANCLWLVTNSKPCPKCTAPIQKNDGCNHMKCTKCKHDFCWVCQEAWSKHSSETGGYFRCNRFEVVTKVDEKAESLLTDAEKKHREMQELNRFIHFYTRFKNHAHSHSLEEPLLRKAVVKMRKLGTRSGPSGPEATKFIQESIQELLRARRILRFSYPYGYYLEDRGGSKQIFEFMQVDKMESTTKEPRFALLTDDELTEFLDSSASENTKKSVRYAMKILDSYCKVRNTTVSALELMNHTDLDNFLRRFYTEVRQLDGEKYSKKSMQSIRYGLQKHFKDRENNPVDIVNDHAFERSNRCFKAMLVHLKKIGKGYSEHKNPITPEDMDKINASPVTDLSTPAGLQNKVYIDTMIYFCNRGRENVRDMKKTDFKINTDSNGLRYITKRDQLTKNNRENSSDKSQAGVMYEVPGNPRCPVNSLLLYMQKLHPICEYFWQRPKDNTCTSSDTTWYCKSPLGKNTLSNKLKEISTAARCGKIYTNHCFRATSVTILDNAGFESRDIMTVSGHHSETSIKNYSRTSESRKRDMSAVISAAVNSKLSAAAAAPSSSHTEPAGEQGQFAAGPSSSHTEPAGPSSSHSEPAGPSSSHAEPAGLTPDQTRQQGQSSPLLTESQESLILRDVVNSPVHLGNITSSPVATNVNINADATNNRTFNFHGCIVNFYR